MSTWFERLRRLTREEPPAPDPGGPIDHHECELMVTALLNSSETATRALRDLLGDLAAGRYPSRGDIAQRRRACEKYLADLAALRSGLFITVDVNRR